MAAPRVLLVDDHALFRDGIASLLRAGGIAVVGQAADGAEAIEKARELHPDLVLMDVRMPGVSGLDATQVIVTEMPDVKVVLLTVSDDDQDLFQAIKSGAAGYILKDTPGEDFSDLVGRVFQGEPAISRGLAAKLLGEFRRGPNSQAPAQGMDDLNEREVEVLRLIAGGATSKEIGTELHIAESTANYHVRNILTKLHVKNRAQAAAYAAQKGLIRRATDSH